jgi:transposase
MSQKLDTWPAVIGIDIGKNSFHIVGQNQRCAIVLRQNGRVARWRPDSPICRRVRSAWRPASARITSVAR